ncbi:MAG: flagellar motor protein MotB [Planctomycetota bacterium]
MSPRRPRPEDEPPVGAPEWIVTFADMTSLLVTFFIMLLTFSTMSQDKITLLHGSLVGAKGIADLPNKASHPLIQSPNQHRAQQARSGILVPPADVIESLAEDAECLVRRIDDPMLLDFERVREGLRVRISSDMLFEAGRAVLRPGHLGILKDIADLLNLKAIEAIIEGHTDNSFQATPRYPTATVLGAARAQAVAQFLQTQGRVAPAKLGIATLGSDAPRADNSTPIGRQLNRRVEILLRADTWGNQG